MLNIHRMFGRSLSQSIYQGFSAYFLQKLLHGSYDGQYCICFNPLLVSSLW